MKTSILKIYAVIFCLLGNFALFAAPTDDTGGVEDIPIDGQVIWLALVGIVFSMYVLYKKRFKTT